MAAPGSVRSGCAGRRRASPADRGAAAVRGARYKRPFDLAVLAFGLVVLLPVWPVLIGAIALAVRLSGPGPVLYRQARLGRGGREFEILKFRTMAADAEARTGPVWAKPEDARPTPVGRVLRRHHLDELPQTLNVLRGEMSLVGPRPERRRWRRGSSAGCRDSGSASRCSRASPGSPRRGAGPVSVRATSCATTSATSRRWGRGWT